MCIDSKGICAVIRAKFYRFLSFGFLIGYKYTILHIPKDLQSTTPMPIKPLTSKISFSVEVNNFNKKITCCPVKFQYADFISGTATSQRSCNLFFIGNVWPISQYLHILPNNCSHQVIRGIMSNSLRQRCNTSYSLSVQLYKVYLPNTYTNFVPQPMGAPATMRRGTKQTFLDHAL